MLLHPDIYPKIGPSIQECGLNGAGEGFYPYRGRSQSGLGVPGLTVSITTLDRSISTVIIQLLDSLGSNTLNYGQNLGHSSDFPFRRSLRDSHF